MSDLIRAGTTEHLTGPQGSLSASNASRSGPAAHLAENWIAGALVGQDEEGQGGKSVRNAPSPGRDRPAGC